MCPESNFILGNIFKERLEDIWQKSPFLKYYRSLKWVPDICKDCKYLHECLCGCRVTNPNKLASLSDTWKEDVINIRMRK
jgi:radical SAM protein with 4Fe4S-binding SPASM domain